MRQVANCRYHLNLPHFEYSQICVSVSREGANESKCLIPFVAIKGAGSKLTAAATVQFSVNPLCADGMLVRDKVRCLHADCGTREHYICKVNYTLWFESVSFNFTFTGLLDKVKLSP
jgi:hypothetical protein